MRLAKPDLEQLNQIHQTGIAFINLFASDLFTKLDDFLKTNHNKEWLSDYRKTTITYLNYNFKDPSNLLKEIIRVSNTPLRIPIRSLVEQKEMSIFFNRLDTILDDRNDWVHHNQSFNKESLKSLILDIYPISKKLDLQVSEEGDYLLSLLAGVDPDVKQVDTQEESQKEPSDLVKVLTDLIPGSEPTIGTFIDEPIIDFSYVLHLNGEIRDRKTRELLSDNRPEVAEYLGALLISRKPSGGRLRVTESGILLAYFEDHWGYLAKVSIDNWFSGHFSS